MKILSNTANIWKDFPRTQASELRVLHNKGKKRLHLASIFACSEKDH